MHARMSLRRGGMQVRHCLTEYQAPMRSARVGPQPVPRLHRAIGQLNLAEPPWALLGLRGCIQKLQWLDNSADRRRRHLSSALGGLHSATAGKLAAAASQPPVSSSKPRVVLIGWLGAQERHFNKYVQLWEGWGHKTLTIRPPTAAIALPLLGDLAAANFARRLHDANVAAAPDQQSVIHLFSNAGFLFFGTMLRLLAASSPATAEQPPQAGASRKEVGTATAADRASQPSLSSVLQGVQGLIIDSAPSHISPDIAARGLVSATLGIPADAVVAAYPRAVAAARALAKPYLGLPPVAGRQKEVWSAWQSVAPLCPQLYLHSSVDALIPVLEVAAFQEAQAARGVEIHSKQWPDSPHCEHYRWHPEEYRAALQSYLASLGTSAGTAIKHL